MRHRALVVQDDRDPGHQPTFSVIVALYNAASTLRATLESFDGQTIQPGLVEYLIVNDGSEDSSLQIVQEWARGKSNVVIVTKPNGGIASTRNEALRLAAGTWITSVDPDDLIEQRYFEEVLKLLQLDKEQKLALLSSRVLVTKHETGHFNNKHPLDKKFRSGNRVVDLRHEPNAFAIGATSFLRREVVREANLEFDERVAPSFEDGNFILKYLTHVTEPILGIVASAHYMYRRVSGGNSAVQGGWSKAEKYTSQVEWGYLGALRYANRRLGHTPDWMAVAISYDLMYYFKEYQLYNSKTRWVGPELAANFMGLCREIFAYISIDQLKLLKPNAPNWSLLQALRIGFNFGEAQARLFRWGKLPNGDVSYTVMHHPDAGSMHLLSRGRLTQVPVDATKVHRYFGETLAVEVSVTLPAGDVALFADGIPCPIGSGPPGKRTFQENQSQDWLAEVSLRARDSAYSWGPKERIRERVWAESLILGISRLQVLRRKLLGKLRSSLIRREDSTKLLKDAVAQVGASGGASKYKDCWLFIDHPGRADDNAEHLYRYVLKERPEINAFFLLERESADWGRLASEGFRLLEYGKPEAMYAALSAKAVLSSDAVDECMYPAPRKVFGKPDYKFVFLQHGISFNDISAWLRGKRISLCVCSTADEYNAFGWKESPYEFRLSELALTGFPRHDALLWRAQERESIKDRPAEGARLLVIPTWRRDLKQQLDSATNQEEAHETFLKSEFGRSWWEFLTHEGLQSAIQRQRLTVDFFLHPNFAAGLAGLPVPEGIRLVSPGEASFQEMLVNADIFVTDYSSLAFDAAYIGRPVSYYHFDADAVGAGTHSWVPGYFDYETMGLGPVQSGAGDLAEWVVCTVERGCAVEKVFAERAEKTFFVRDGQNSVRVVDAVKAMLSDDSVGSRTVPLKNTLPPSFGSDSELVFTTLG